MTTDPFRGIPCRECGRAALRLEYREEFQTRPFGTVSLAGVQTKTAGQWVQWPWCVCSDCGAESKGKK